MSYSRIIYIFFLFALAFSGCKKPNQFVIQGKISHAEGEMIYLEELKVSYAEPIDSVKINNDGEFKFKHNTGFPSFYLLKLSENNFITLLVDSSETITIGADAVDFTRNYDITGSEGSELVQLLNYKLNQTLHKLDSITQLERLYVNSPDYETIKSQLDESYIKIIQDQIDFSTEFVEKNPFSMASLLALYQTFNDGTYIINDLLPIKTVASALDAVYPESEHVRALYANTLELMKEEDRAAIRNFIEEYGENSANIVLPDPYDEEIELYSLRGKYVLLQFWSANDAASRTMNSVLTELYDLYKNKDFEIYQVSIDQDRSVWIDAIDADGLSWINVGDMQGSRNALAAYNIQTIPFNYLLDKEGVVIGKDLKGPALTNKLSEIFN